MYSQIHDVYHLSEAFDYSGNLSNLERAKDESKIEQYSRLLCCLQATQYISQHLSLVSQLLLQNIQVHMELVAKAKFHYHQVKTLLKFNYLTIKTQRKQHKEEQNGP